MATAKRSKQGGIALLTVLWVVALLTVAVGGFSYLVRTELLLVRNQGQALQARLAAEAGAARGLQLLVESGADERRQRDGRRYPVSLAQAQSEVGLRDTSGLVDLNQAAPALLAALLAGSGVEADERDRLVDRLLDWRDADDLVRLHGGERRDYLAAGLDYGPKNGPFERVDELGWVPGFSPALVDRLRPHLTLHSGQSGLNPQVASAELLQLLVRDSGLVQEVLAQRELGNLAYTLLRGRVNWPLAGSSGVVQINARGQTEGGAVAELAVVARMVGGDRGYQVLSWEPVTGTMAAESNP